MRPRLFHPPLGSAAYHQFHGMLCGPSAAAACVQSFDGTIVFAPSTYDAEDFRAATQNNLPLPFEVQSLTVLKYYLLVLFSITGLCSLLRQTQTMQASDTIASGGKIAEPPASHPLAVHPLVVDSIVSRHGIRGDGSSVRLVRRYEFRFRLIGLWVAMHHYCARDASGKETLSLVEVYKAAPPLVLAAGVGAAAALALGLNAMVRRALVVCFA